MKIFRQIFSYTTVNIVNACIPFLLLPFLTSNLSTDAYGKLSLLQVFQTILMPFVLLNFYGLVTIEYSKMKSTVFNSFISSISLVPICGFFFVSLIVLIFNERFACYLNVDKYWIFVSPFYILLQAFPLLLPVIFQASKNVKKYALFKISLSIVNIISTIFFIAFLGFGWEGRIFALIFTQTVFSIVAIIIMFRANFISLSFDVEYVRQALKFGIPLIPHTLSGTLLVSADRLVLAKYLSADFVGIYTVSFQIAFVVSLIASSVNQAWVPELFELLNNKPDMIKKRKIVKQSYLLILLMFAISLASIAVIPLIYKVFVNERYHDGVTVARLLAIAFFLQGTYFMFTNYIFYSKKTHILSGLTLISAISLLALNYFLVPYFGILGSAYSAICGWLMLVILAFLVARKLYPMPWVK